ncbi:MAG: VanW family protein [Pseudonocardia sp.]
MPERQSSPGEVAARPEMGGTEPDVGSAPDVQQGPEVGKPEPAAPPGDAPVGDDGEPTGADAEPLGAPPSTSEPVRNGNGQVVSAAVPTPGAAEQPRAETPGPSEPGSPASAEGAAPDRPRPRPRPHPAQPVGPDEEIPAADVQAPAAGSDHDPGGDAPTKVVRVVAPSDPPPDAPLPADTEISRPPQDSQSSWFRAADAEATQVIPTPPTAAPAVASTGPIDIDIDPPTDRFPIVAAGRPPRPPHRRRLLVLAGVLGALVLLYVGDLVVSSGSVPRGVTVAGVQIGGLGVDEAEQRLRSEIEPRLTQPVAVTVGAARSEINPVTAGLTVNWAATLERVGSQPLNPITRITSFFTEREVSEVNVVDAPALNAALEELAPIVDKAPVEGTVQFDGTTPVPVDPVAGQRLDVGAAAEVLRRDWAGGGLVILPLVELAPTTTPEDVATAIQDVARPAVSAPVSVAGEGETQATITPEVIASALSFRADANALVPEINQLAVVEALKPQLAPSERPGRDAALDFSSGSPVVVPSQDGRGVDYDATLSGLLPVLTGTGPRQITAVYADQPAELTTDELNELGISGLIGEFETNGFAKDSGLNIKRAAEQINGTIVAPGETFSLNAATLPRDAANGYVEAGVISDGHPDRGIGGGVSQLATTLYNASYFAGMVDVEHREHSFYISRYPAGREATVFDNVIDLKFRNDNPTGVMIQTAWTPSSITVRLYGTKRYEVTSTPGPRTNPTSPTTVTIPAGEPCSPSQGAPGFTITDTRTLREISTGAVTSKTRTVRYNPSPIVVCE